MNDKIVFIIKILLYGSIILILLGFSNFIGPLTSIVVWLIPSVITTGIIQIFLQAVTGDLLEKIPFTYKIQGIKFSFSLFFLVVIALNLIFFNF